MTQGQFLVSLSVLSAWCWGGLLLRKDTEQKERRRGLNGFGRRGSW